MQKYWKDDENNHKFQSLTFNFFVDLIIAIRGLNFLQKPEKLYIALILCNLVYTKWANMQQKQQEMQHNITIWELIIVCGTTLSIPLFINYTSARFCHSYSSDICIVHNINCCHSLICTIRSLNLWLHEHLISMLAMHNPHTWLATNGSNFHVNKIKYPWWKI